jgi:hypothetical protein
LNERGRGGSDRADDPQSEGSRKADPKGCEAPEAAERTAYRGADERADLPTNEKTNYRPKSGANGCSCAGSPVRAATEGLRGGGLDYGRAAGDEGFVESGIWRRRAVTRAIAWPDRSGRVNTCSKHSDRGSAIGVVVSLAFGRIVAIPAEGAGSKRTGNVIGEPKVEQTDTKTTLLKLEGVDKLVGNQ